MSRLSAHTKDRTERFFFKIIMSLKEKFVRHHVLNVKKCLSSDSFLLLSFVPLFIHFTKPKISILQPEGLKFIYPPG